MYGFLHYILTASQNRPFFLHKWFLEPHGPYDPPVKFKKNIDVDLSKLSEESEYYIEIARKFMLDKAVKKMSHYELNY